MICSFVRFITLMITQESGPPPSEEKRKADRSLGLEVSLGFGAWSLRFSGFSPYGLGRAKSLTRPMSPAGPDSGSQGRVEADPQPSLRLATVRTRATKCNPRTRLLRIALLACHRKDRYVGSSRIAIPDKETRSRATN